MKSDKKPPIATAEAARELLRRQAEVTEHLNQAHAKEPSPEERRLIRNLKTKLPVTVRW